jgi:hypothetical protein
LKIDDEVQSTKAQNWSTIAEVHPAFDSKSASPAEAAPAKPPSPEPRQGPPTRNAEVAPDLFFVGVVPDDRVSQGARFE